MKKELLHKILIFNLIFLSVCAYPVEAITFERGDALFSNGFLEWLAGHSMLYYGWKKTGDPLDPFQHI